MRQNFKVQQLGIFLQLLRDQKRIFQGKNFRFCKNQIKIKTQIKTPTKQVNRDFFVLKFLWK